MTRSRRSPNLTSERVAAIVEVIRAWEGRLTWPALIKSVAKKMHCNYTRQALFNQELIRVAYETYRASNKEGSPGSGRPVSAALRAALDRSKRLELALAEAQKRESLLLEQFVRWAYNAGTRGLTVDFLNQPLPPTNRLGNRQSRR
ncbi:hypothetical protein HF925_05700 [Acidithiobacillus ferriphilus]|uniref:hypothetical protein n=1 Tax=Acidithiobacillus ferriphilus TaxID=1689834 RepID=UPI001C07E4CB|nr:hypothetical protein [Acidithiobacillus ferriphilus]MBU2848079.1 hypothetical protein [Acidithiobacillus ferriphilus]